MYPFYNWANNNKAFLILLALALGYFTIGLYLFKKALKYTDEIITSMDEINKEDDNLISLSGDLRDVTNKMNNIKLSLREKERLARDVEKRKNDLIVYLAHDLKTPLTSIIGYLTILKEEEDLSQSFRKKYLGISHNKALRLEDLINEFFDITRYNLQDINLEKAKVDFSLMMDQIIFEFKPLLKEKSLSIINEIERDIQLNIDPNKIERVLDNVIRNAINYSYSNEEIKVLVKKIEDFVQVDIINYGVTIPQAKLDHIFDEFFRLDFSRSSKTGGAGLGLAIAKSIVVAHKGEIYADSQDGEVNITIRLPLEPL